MTRMLVMDALEKYNRAKTIRSPHEQQFRMNSAYCLPRDYSRWTNTGGNSIDTSGNRTSNDVQARFAFDNTGVRCIPKYVAICKRLINPDNVRYHKLAADNDDLMRVPAVRQFFDLLTDKLFRMRQTPDAGFGTAQAEIYASLAVYGTGPKSLTWRTDDDGAGGFAYKAWPLYDIFFLVDDFSRVTDVFRRFSLTKRQFRFKWPDDPYPISLSSLLDSDVVTTSEFVHVVSKRGGDSYDKKALDARRLPWSSNYLCVKDQMYIGEEAGFLTNPYMLPRTMTIAGDPYGYAPAEQAFPALGGVNAMKKTVLKLGHKAADPPLLANDDGVLSGRVDQRPGRVTYGGLDNQGRPMVREMTTNSNFQIAETLISDERADINDSFLVSLFQILTENPEMTAAEVYERIAEKAALFAPTKASLEEQDQGPQIQREVGLLAEKGMLPKVPPEMVEAKGQYKVNYTNPMNKALHASEVSGFMRWSTMGIEAAQATQDPSPLDWINWDVAMPEIGDKMDVRSAWIASREEVEAKREARQAAQEQQQIADAAPAIASVAATASKQGMRMQ